MLNYIGTVQSVSEVWYLPELAILFFLWNVREIMPMEVVLLPIKVQFSLEQKLQKYEEIDFRRSNLPSCFVRASW